MYGHACQCIAVDRYVRSNEFLCSLWVQKQSGFPKSLIERFVLRVSLRCLAVQDLYCMCTKFM